MSGNSFRRQLPIPGMIKRMRGRFDRIPDPIDLRDFTLPGETCCPVSLGSRSGCRPCRCSTSRRAVAGTRSRRGTSTRSSACRRRPRTAAVELQGFWRAAGDPIRIGSSSDLLETGTLRNGRFPFPGSWSFPVASWMPPPAWLDCRLPGLIPVGMLVDDVRGVVLHSRPRGPDPAHGVRLLGRGVARAVPTDGPMAVRATRLELVAVRRGLTVPSTPAATAALSTVDQFCTRV